MSANNIRLGEESLGLLQTHEKEVVFHFLMLARCRVCKLQSESTQSYLHSFKDESTLFWTTLCEKMYWRYSSSRSNFSLFPTESILCLRLRLVLLQLSLLLLLILTMLVLYQLSIKHCPVGYLQQASVLQAILYSNKSATDLNNRF